MKTKDRVLEEYRRRYNEEGEIMTTEEIIKLVREDIITEMKRMRDEREGTRLSWDLRTMMEVIKIIKKGEVKP
uniref:Uncharacterized protein n=1 Tax=viral metagenome TaxID=1070528 RepID=A0A6M3LHS0_9ZZZZ